MSGILNRRVRLELLDPYLSLDKARPREERVAGELVGAAC